MPSDRHQPANHGGWADLRIVDPADAAAEGRAENALNGPARSPIRPASRSEKIMFEIGENNAPKIDARPQLDRQQLDLPPDMLELAVQLSDDAALLAVCYPPDRQSRPRPQRQDRKPATWRWSLAMRSIAVAVVLIGGGIYLAEAFWFTAASRSREVTQVARPPGSLIPATMPQPGTNRPPAGGLDAQAAQVLPVALFTDLPGAEQEALIDLLGATVQRLEVP
jgi:hypothetical protein